MSGLVFWPGLMDQFVFQSLAFYPGLTDLFVSQSLIFWQGLTDLFVFQNISEFFASHFLDEDSGLSKFHLLV